MQKQERQRRSPHQQNGPSILEMGDWSGFLASLSGGGKGSWCISKNPPGMPSSTQELLSGAGVCLGGKASVHYGPGLVTSFPNTIQVLFTE